MVKGIAKQVILVRQPDPRFFEEAIFIVKEDAGAHSGVSADQVLEEAKRVARGYVLRSRLRTRPLWLWTLLGAAGGAVAASALWALALFL